MFQMTIGNQLHLKEFLNLSMGKKNGQKVTRLSKRRSGTWGGEKGRELVKETRDKKREEEEGKRGGNQSQIESSWKLFGCFREGERLSL